MLRTSCINPVLGALANCGHEDEFCLYAHFHFQYANF